MAERRMFAKAIIGSGKFLRMPPSTRLLYYDLGMYADDDGIVEAFTVMRQTGATEDDLRVLVSKGFVRILNDELVTVIADWKVNNLIRQDRYNPSIYKDLLIQIDNTAVNQLATNGEPEEYQRLPQVSIGKVSQGKVRKEKKQLNVTGEYIYEIPLNDNTFFGVTEEYISKLRELYPAANIDIEFRKMLGWCDGNRTRLKTRSGVKRFINGWLGRAQNEGGNKNAGGQRPDYGRLGTEV